MEPQHVHSQESQDAAIQQLYSMLCSPSLSRFAAEAKNYVPSEMDGGLEGSSTSTSPYQTRSRVGAPFSPPRTAVTRLGHTYHITDPQYEQPLVREDAALAMEETEKDAPVIHIPDSSSHDGLPVHDLSLAEAEYVNFIEELHSGSDNLLKKPLDDRRKDPTFYLKKRDDEESKDDYCKKVPAREIRNLREDLQQNPIPGFELPLQVEEEPLIVTRSASRCRSIEMQGCSPSPSASPMKSPMTSPFQSRMAAPLVHSYPTNHEASVIAARTRAQLAKSPQKPIPASINSVVEGFKKPLPVGELHGKKQKTVPPAQPLVQNHGGNCSSSLSDPTPSPTAMSPEIKNRFRAVGLKYSKFSTSSSFSAEDKLFVQQMVNKAITKYVPNQGIVLAEYVMRMVELLSGERSVTQIQSCFLDAKKIDFSFVCLVFGVLVPDESPLILDLTPILYGKTRLVKAIWMEMLVANGRPEEQENLMRTFKMAMKMNDRPYGMPKVDLTSCFAVRLGITGEEGLIDPAVFKFTEEDTIYNPEELLAETALSDRMARDSVSRESAATALVTAIQNVVTSLPKQTPLVMRNLQSDLTHAIEGQSDGSNSSMHAMFTDVSGTGDTGNAPPSALAVDILSGNANRTASGFEFLAAVEERVPRRVQLITTALTGSPLKNQIFEIDDRKMSLRSALRKLPTME